MSELRLNPPCSICGQMVIGLHFHSVSVDTSGRIVGEYPAPTPQPAPEPRSIEDIIDANERAAMLPMVAPEPPAEADVRAALSDEPDLDPAVWRARQLATPTRTTMRLTGTVNIATSDTDPGDFGEPRTFQSDGEWYVTVPSWAALSERPHEPALDVERTVKVFLFLLDRLEHVYDENPNYDYMRTGRELVARLAAHREDEA